MSTLDSTGIVGRVPAYVRRLGPAWLAGAIAAGPATMASLLTAGASFGYTLLWVVVLSAAFGTISQYLAARLGLLTETGIVTAVERHLGEAWAWLLVVDTVLASGLAQLVIMKTLADVSEVVTGVNAGVWGIVWAIVLAVGLAGGGYRVAELGAKLLVSAVVLVFLASLVVVGVESGPAAAGLVPTIPAGVDGALVAAGILGGAVHITLVTMHSYTMRERGWTRQDADLATVDVVSSMFVAFGIYSLAIFFVAANVLPSLGMAPSEVTAIAAAQALGPAVGPYAQWLFLLGLWGAAVSTLGGNTVVPPYLLADKLGFEQDVSDPRYRALVVIVALLSAGGAFLGGEFFPLLVLVLAFGLVGTPFALAIVLYLLNDPRAVPETNSATLNLAGLALIVVTIVLAGSHVLEQAITLAAVGGPLAAPIPAVVVAFAALVGLATLLLAAKFATGGNADATPTRS